MAKAKKPAFGGYSINFKGCTDTLEAVIRCRYDVLARYARSLKRTYGEELRKLRRYSPQEARALRVIKPWLVRMFMNTSGRPVARAAALSWCTGSKSRVASAPQTTRPVVMSIVAGGSLSPTETSVRVSVLYSLIGQSLRR